MMIYQFIASAMCVWFVHAVSSHVITVDGNTTTLASLCNNSSVKNDSVIQLNVSLIHLTIDCVFDYKSSLTLNGLLYNSTIIDCLHNGSENGSLSFISSSSITLSNIIIRNCGTNITARTKYLRLPHALKNQLVTLLLIECVNITITDFTMTNNLGINLVGINVLGNSVLDNVTIQNVALVPSRFNDSYLTSSAAMFQFFNSSKPSNLIIYNSNFMDNTNILPEGVLDYLYSYILPYDYRLPAPLLTPGLNIGFLQNNSYNISVLVKHTKFTGNHGRFGGAIFLAFANPVTNYSMRIENCLFQENTVDKKYIQTSYGAGIIAISVNDADSKGSHSKSHDLLVVTNSIFASNSAVIGTCIYLYLFVNGQSVGVRLDNLTFSNNKGDVATAVYIEDHLLYEHSSTILVYMTNITAEHNQLIYATSTRTKPLSDVNGLFVFFNVKNVTMKGNSNRFFNNTPGVMGLSGTDVLFDHGKFCFIRNTAPISGGAVYLTDGSTMTIHNKSLIIFDNNRARIMGGAIYSDNSEGFATFATVCPIQFHLINDETLCIFVNNTAPRGGNAIFASQLYPCGWFPTFGSLPYSENVNDVYSKYFNFSSTAYELTELCNCSSNCSNFSQSSHEMIRTPAHKLYYNNNSSDKCFNISQGEITSTAYKVCFCNKTTKRCCEHHNNSTSPGRSLTLYLMVVDRGYSPLYSVVHFMPTENVSPAKVDVMVNCTEVDVTLYGIPNTTVNITLRPSVPLYTDNVNLTVHFTYCPVGLNSLNNSCMCISDLKKKGFCVDSTDGLGNIISPKGAWIRHMDSSLYFNSYCDVAYCDYSSTNKCRNRRDGILCGKCIENYSVVFGSQDCRKCYNYALVTLLGYIIIGIVIVVLLPLLKLTVDQGIINGAIFYANIVYINHNLLYIEDIEVLPNFFNVLNLDPPVGICFYRGMTALPKYALQLAFPVYLWLLVLLIVLLIRKFPRVSNVVQSPAQLLATLIYLSYSKLLLIISFIVKPIQVSEIHYRKEEIISTYRWYHDPNLEYGEAWHLVMVIVSAFIFLVFLLPFAIVLTFPNYCLGFRCLIRFKPIIDSYTAPYKDRWASWLGIHLLILILFFVLLAIQGITYKNPEILFLIIILITILLTSVQLYFRPYKNGWVNFLDTLFLLNLILGGCIVLWLVKNENGYSFNGSNFRLTIYFFLTIAALEILVIIIYHIIMVIPLGELYLMRFYKLLTSNKDITASGTFSDHGYQQQPARLSSSSEDRPLLGGIQDTPPKFRESLLEYDTLVAPRS